MQSDERITRHLRRQQHKCRTTEGSLNIFIDTDAERYRSTSMLTTMWGRWYRSVFTLASLDNYVSVNVDAKRRKVRLTFVSTSTQMLNIDIYVILFLFFLCLISRYRFSYSFTIVTHAPVIIYHYKKNTIEMLKLLFLFIIFIGKSMMMG